MKKYDKLIKNALDQMKHEKFLFDFKNKRPPEETVNHLLAKRIKVNDFQTDVEYAIDQTTGQGKGQNELAKILIPDIIIHSRGSNKSNECVIECKWIKNFNKERVIWDIFKLFYFSLSDAYLFKSAFLVFYSEQTNKESKIISVEGDFKKIKEQILKELEKNKNKQSLIFEFNLKKTTFDDFISSVSFKIKDLKINQSKIDKDIFEIKNKTSKTTRFYNRKNNTFTNDTPIPLKLNTLS